jgi:hypothetical protein
MCVLVTYMCVLVYVQFARLKWTPRPIRTQSALRRGRTGDREHDADDRDRGAKVCELNGLYVCISVPCAREHRKPRLTIQESAPLAERERERERERDRKPRIKQGLELARKPLQRLHVPAPLGRWLQMLLRLFRIYLLNNG